MLLKKGFPVRESYRRDRADRMPLKIEKKSLISSNHTSFKLNEKEYKAFESRHEYVADGYREVEIAIYADDIPAITPHGAVYLQNTYYIEGVKSGVSEIKVIGFSLPK